MIIIIDRIGFWTTFKVKDEDEEEEEEKLES